MDDKRTHVGRRGEVAHAVCVVEVLAPKAGNVCPEGGFDDASWVDFVISAQAVRGVLDRAPQRGVGRTILDAVIATRQTVGTNTNLGMILLLAPLCAVPDDVELSPGVEMVLANMTAEDTALVYEAIRLAQPGGLGKVENADVASTAPMSLVHAMAMAAPYDTVARQYVTSFHGVFHCLAPRFEALGPPLDQAIVTVHLEQMADEPDSLIRRKCGRVVAEESQAMARAVLDAGWPETSRSQRAFEALDTWLRQEGNRRNPGTSADLVAAALYVVLWLGRIRLPSAWFGSLQVLEDCSLRPTAG